MTRGRRVVVLRVWLCVQPLQSKAAYVHGPYRTRRESRKHKDATDIVVPVAGMYAVVR